MSIPALVSRPGDAQLRAALSTYLEAGTEAAAVTQRLCDEGLLDLPHPGFGRTAERFAALTTLGELDLTIARLGEAHADAVAIMAELDSPPLPTGARCGVWAAEPPGFRVHASPQAEGWSLAGTKSWCSGASSYTHALVTADADEGPRLFLLDLAQDAVRPQESTWWTSALAGSDTRAVQLSDASAVAIGGVDDYVGRPGFWHGAVGVAAVWYGGAVSIGRTVARAAAKREPDDIGWAHLGAIDASLFAARSSIAVAAATFDGDPRDATGRAAALARRTRAVVESTVAEVIDRAGRALGPGPLSSDAHHASQVADLQLYVRQSHADRDLADLGRRLRGMELDW